MVNLTAKSGILFTSLKVMSISYWLFGLHLAIGAFKKFLITLVNSETPRISQITSLTELLISLSSNT
jgi:hypothetical protein